MSSVRSLPLWLRYVVAFGAAAIIFVVIVVWVHDHQSQSEGQAANPSAQQAAQEQREDQAVVEQQQAPHVAKLATGVAPRAAATVAVLGYMRDQTSRALITGPVDGQPSCTVAGGSSGRQLFRCRVYAGPKGTVLKYPFQAVVEPGAARVTYCQVVTPPYPLTAIPLQAACR